MPTPFDETLTQQITVVDFASLSPLPEVTVRACGRLGWSDPQCLPGVTLKAEGITDVDGKATLSVEYPLISVKRPWDGYLLAEGEGLVPDLRIFSTPRTNDFEYRFGVIKEAFYDLVSQAHGVTRQPGEGDLGVTVYDCKLAAAAGVEVDLVPRPKGVRRAYSTGEPLVFDESLTETGVDGTVIFSNVPGGKPLKLRATVVATGELLNEIDVLVLPSVRTGVVLEPRVQEQ